MGRLSCVRYHAQDTVAIARLLRCMLGAVLLAALIGERLAKKSSNIVGIDLQECTYTCRCVPQHLAQYALSECPVTSTGSGIARVVSLLGCILSSSFTFEMSIPFLALDKEPNIFVLQDVRAASDSALIFALHLQRALAPHSLQC